jgi:FixJ family two-component response regulator
MNGVDLAREVRDRFPRLPIVLMSGYSDGLPATNNEFRVLRKPIPYEDLYDVIRTCLTSDVLEPAQGILRTTL